MSEINGMTGQPFNHQPSPQSEPQERVSFEDPTVSKLNELMQSEEAEGFQRLALEASRTKFATGNRETDIRNLLNFKSLIAGLVGFIEPND